MTTLPHRDPGVRARVGRLIALAVAVTGGGLLGGSLVGCAHAHRVEPTVIHETDENEAALHQRSCDTGQLNSCFVEGMMYQDGLGVPQDERRAAGLFERACDGSVQAACAHLATLVLSGHLGAPDTARALGLYRGACDHGVPGACSQLAGMYATGNGVPRSRARAAALLRRACAGGVQEACGVRSRAGGMRARTARAHTARLR